MEYTTIGESCSVVSGGTPSRSKTEYWRNGTIPWIKIGNIKSKYVNEYDELITEQGLNNSSAKLLKKGTILYTIFATLGEVGILDTEACTNQAIAGININDPRITTDYLYYYLKSKKDYVNNIGRGVAQNNINLTTLKKFEIPLINVDKQLYIVEVLEKVERMIGLKKKEIDDLDLLIKARFIEMFGDVQHEEKYKGIQLRELCTTMSGGTPSTKFPEYYEGDIPWISTISLGPNHIDGTTAKGYITQKAIDNSATKLIRAGNILFGTRVGVGKSSLNDVDICTNQDIVAIIGIDERKFNKLFIKHVLDAHQSYYDSIKKGATILGITVDDLKDTLIPDAPIDVQLAFEKFVEQVDKSKLAVQQSLEKTQLLFDSLMQEYFGEN